jgi:carbon storage regulator
MAAPVRVTRRGFSEPREGGIPVLVLTRKVGESIVIGDDIRVMVKEVRGCRVRLAIDAPRDMQISRDELRDNGDGIPKVSVSP